MIFFSVPCDRQRGIKFYSVVRYLLVDVSGIMLPRAIAGYQQWTIADRDTRMFEVVLLNHIGYHLQVERSPSAGMLRTDRYLRRTLQAMENCHKMHRTKITREH